MYVCSSYEGSQVYRIVSDLRIVVQFGCDKREKWKIMNADGISFVGLGASK